MNEREAVLKLLEDNNGYITTSQVDEAGYQRRILRSLVSDNCIYRVERGIYALPDIWEDEMYFLQYRFSKGVFSNETALFIHGLTDRTPQALTMTFPQGYNAGGLKKYNAKAKFVIKNIYDIGLTEVMSNCGNRIRVYDKERTLCDIVKGKNTCDIQIVNQAMKTYAASTEKNIAKLIEYAKDLRVKPKIVGYMEILL